jgi:hypothetical protein
MKPDGRTPFRSGQGFAIDREVFFMRAFTCLI